MLRCPSSSTIKILVSLTVNCNGRSAPLTFTRAAAPGPPPLASHTHTHLQLVGAPSARAAGPLSWTAGCRHEQGLICAGARRRHLAGQRGSHGQPLMGCDGPATHIAHTSAA